ncbi:class I adenylate-forming enzyme family protein [Bacillus cereus]
MSGYLNMPDETEKVLKDRWLYTGDIGYKDSDGYIYIIRRKNDIIKYLGYRISPVEIENYINMHDNILESAVVECRKEENVKIAAVIVLKNEKLDINDLSQILRRKLPSYKIPSIIYTVDKLPKTSNGKIKRSELKEMLKQSFL